MISVEEARARILAALTPVGAETVPLAASLGRVLAAPVLGWLTQPPADVSAMDGYALRAAEASAGARLKLIGQAPAGRPFGGTVGAGEVVRVFTGSVMPAGADTVLIQENASEEGEFVIVREAAAPNRHIRRAGQDFAAGQELIAPGNRLTPRQIGLAAAANHPWLTVYRRPLVALLATGDEISLPGEPLVSGGIVSSNAHALAAAITAAGGEALVLPITRDDAAAIAVAAGAMKADLLVTTGGASVGAHDLVYAGLKASGFTLEFWKIAMRPGKPLLFGRLGETPAIGLPGNPVSALVCTALFVLPALAKLAGLPEAPLPTEPAILAVDLPANNGRTDFLRARLTLDEQGRFLARPFPVQDSAMLRVLAEADALLLRRPHAAAAAAGSPVEILRLASLGL